MRGQLWEGRIFSDFLLSNNSDELVNQTTHIRDDHLQLCIDLVCMINQTCSPK